MPGDCIIAKTERAKSKSPLCRTNYSRHDDKQETSRNNKSFSNIEQKQKKQHRIADKENRVDLQPSNVTQKTSTSTPFQINRLLNKLTSPRGEFESQTKTSTTTSQLSSRNVSNSTIVIEEKAQKQFFNEILSHHHPHNNQHRVSPESKKNERNGMKHSKLLNPSPSFDNDYGDLIEQKHNETSSFMTTISSGLDTKNNEQLEDIASRITNHNDDDNVMLESGQRELSLKAQSSQNPVSSTNPLESGGNEELDRFEPRYQYTSVEFSRRQLCSELLHSSTQNFLDPLPHSYRLPTETEERKSQEFSPRWQEQGVGNSRPLLTATFNTPGKEFIADTPISSNTKQDMLKQGACKEDSRIQNQRYSERPSNVGTQLTLSYSKYTYENLDLTNSQGSFEVKDSAFEACEIDQASRKSHTGSPDQVQVKEEDGLLFLNEGGTHEGNNGENELSNLRNYASNQTKVEPKWRKKQLSLTNIDDSPVPDLLSIVSKITLENNLSELHETPSNPLKPRTPLMYAGLSTNKTTSSKQSGDQDLRSSPRSNSLGTFRSQKHSEYTLDTSRNPVLYDDLSPQTNLIGSPVIPVFRKTFIKAPEVARHVFLISHEENWIDHQNHEKRTLTENEQDQANISQESPITMPKQSSKVDTSMEREIPYNLTPERKDTLLMRKKSSPSRENICFSFGMIKKDSKQASPSLHSTNNPIPHDDNKENHVINSKVQLTCDPGIHANKYSEVGYLSARSCQNNVLRVEDTRATETSRLRKTKQSSLLLQEQRLPKTTTEPNINHHLQKFVVSISSLQTFCQNNQIFIENLLDEVFQYLNTYSVSRNYFVQILTSYLNNFPLTSPAITHKDISLKIFEICDKNNDGIITVNDLGENSLLFCQRNPEMNPQAGLLYYLLDPENKGSVTKPEFVAFVKKIHSYMMMEPDKYAEMREELESPKSEAFRMFKDIDKEQRGKISYWDIYMWKDTFLFSQLIERVNKCLGALLAGHE